jgi:aspartyl-tRNA(Asn)/glutamyl-tRNA(Gln) amidotransferase subunit C
MSLTSVDIEKVAHLARLQFTAQDSQQFTQALTNIFTMIDQLNRIKTDVQPLAHPIDAATQRLRPDIITETDQSDQIKTYAPQIQDNLFLVPKVIE